MPLAISAGPDAAVEQHRNLGADRVCYGRKLFESRNRAVDLTAPVIGDADTIHAGFDRPLGVVRVEDALEQERQASSTSQELQIRPREVVAGVDGEKPPYGIERLPRADARR